jgi:5'-phosphate synthase pdxT subunit
MAEEKGLVIGVLALQGDFAAHQKMLARLGVETILVRSPKEVAAVDALIIPGGESTTIGKLMRRFGLDEAIYQRVTEERMPLYGTCAGLILMAKEIEGSDQLRLGVLDVTVARNAFGRQVESFEANIALPELGEPPVRGVFIRAPYVTKAAESVQALGRFEEKIVAVRQGHLLGTAFHPELTDDTRVHAFFAALARESRNRS